MTMKHPKGTDRKGRYRDWLIERATEAKRIVEVGAFAGKTTRKMARVSPGVIFAVDHWRGVPHDKRQAEIYRNMPRTEAKFHTFCEEEIRGGKIGVLKMDSLSAAAFLLAAFGPGSFDLVFIDADHGYWACRKDIQAWRPLVEPGGILCGHDRQWEGVANALQHEFGDDWETGPGSLWWRREG